MSKNNSNKNKEKVTNTKITKATKNKQEKIKEIDTIEESLNEELESEVIIEKKSSKNKNNSKEKIEKIERIAKEKKRKNSKNNEKLEKTLLFLEKNRYTIYGFIGGVLLTTLVAFIIWPDRIAALKNGEEPIVKVGKETYTADELYENMKEFYSVSLLLDDIDNDLLTKLYPEDEEMKKAVDEDAKYYLNMYNQYYGYDEATFLEKNGFSNYNEFLDVLTLDYRRNQYLDDYLEKNLTDDEIEKYYNDNVFGDIRSDQRDAFHGMREFAVKCHAVRKVDNSIIAQNVVSKAAYCRFESVVGEC